MSIIFGIKLTVRLFVVLMTLHNVETFLTDHVSYPILPKTDYTLTELTEETLVRVVARYFEESNQDKYNPGDLLDLEPLTASSLFQKHFGDFVSSGHFKSAVHEIVEGNLDIDRYFSYLSQWHFNAEQIHEGNRLMISLRLTILAALKNDDPDYAGIRENIGKYLHLLQDFYSNTNWVELYPNDVNLDLGIRELTDAVASSRDRPCRNCLNFPKAGKPEEHDCRKSLNYNIQIRSLYSGYRSGQNINKPIGNGHTWGKCSHGGKFDSTWTRIATGGINKDSSNPAVSPHYYLHQEAAKLAIRAGEIFFNDKENGIKSLTDDTKFRQLVNLDSGRSIAFVMDDTGSMSQEINAALNTAKLLVNQFAETFQTSKQCIVSPFNDPDIGPLTQSDNAQVCADALGRLHAHDGGDCPELSMSGIEAALEKLIYPAKVYVWTDADAKDEYKMAEVMSLAMEMNVEMTFILTGTCGRRKRSVEGTDVYSLLASATGGAVYHATDSDVSSVSNIVLAESAASEITIIRWTSNSFTKVSLDIPADSTMDKLTVKVSGPGPKAKTQLFDPAGSPLPFDTSNNEVIVDANNLLIFSVNASMPGNWSLRLDHVTLGNTYQVEVTANSFLDFVYQIMELSPLGFLVPIEGSPLAGSNGTFTIEIINPELHKNISELILYDMDGETILLRAPLYDIAGPTLEMYTANVVVPEQEFTVSIVGTDVSGYKIQRLQTEAVNVLGFSLALSNNNNTAGNLIPGESGSFLLDLDNTGADDVFDLNVMVMKKSSALTNPIVASVTPSNIDLASGGSAFVLVTLDANQAAKAGDSVTSGERNFLSYTITLAEPVEIVVPQNDDTIPPNCNIIDIEDNCTADRILRNCDSNYWLLRTNLQDNRAISLITVADFEVSNSNYTVERSNDGDIELIIESNCCCPNITVSVEDTSGNLGLCEVDHLMHVEGIDIGQCVRDCAKNTDCYNEGLCIRGRCDCAPGFTGTLCEQNIDDCASDPCLHEGTCQDGIQIYYCNCTDTGYEGLRCEIDIDYCVEDFCENNGLCIEEVNGYTCNCDGTGFKGIECETDVNECETGVCMNGGSCTNMNGTFDCDCYPGWKGTICDLNVDECENDTLCVHNATCQDTAGSYACECPAGYQGNVCDTECDHGRYGLNCGETCTCVNGATCSRADGGCECNKLFDDQACNKANLKVSITAKNMTIDAADNITLTCNVNLPAFDIGNMVVWSLPDNSIKNTSQSDTGDNGMYVLELVGMHNASDAGRYGCFAQTDLQTEILQASAFIDLGINHLNVTENSGGVMMMPMTIGSTIIIVAVGLSTLVVY